MLSLARSRLIIFTLRPGWCWCMNWAIAWQKVDFPAPGAPMMHCAKGIREQGARREVEVIVKRSNKKIESH